MAKPSTGPNFLSLPTELRMHIAAEALEQHPLSGFHMVDAAPENGSRYILDTRYRPSANLSIRLVCRQFNIDFTRLAIQKTRFVLQKDAGSTVSTQSETILRDVKRLVVHYGPDTIAEWREFPFNKECLQLDELDMFMPLAEAPEYSELVGMFRRLRNVQRIRFLLCGDEQQARLRCCWLIGVMLKEDHYQRYDAPNAPNLESSWWSWSWSFNDNYSWVTFVAQEPKPVMVEEEYMMLVKPKLDEIMEATAGALG
ncbi:hypothetical protein yc1106_04717 [Curvularia clavata]|uniref:Uncharacterized protein n=1 Tax=Curvularia clavata TaxID=95742 RepID=A0A9Q8ZAY2_CURCL|nr:hypothetical protein yc1106_04717 [Curvularia clavata]